MAAQETRRLPRPERIRFLLLGAPPDGVDLHLTSRRNWPIGIILGATFMLFAGIAIAQIGSMRGDRVKTVFDLMFILFQGFWVLGWSVGVLVLFLLTVLVLFYQESALISDGRLFLVPRLGPLRILVEYDLAKIRNLRVVTAGSEDQVKVRFDYGEGEKNLGSAMPRAQAEALARGIQRRLPAPGPSNPRPSNADVWRQATAVRLEWAACPSGRRRNTPSAP